MKENSGKLPVATIAQQEQLVRKTLRAGCQIHTPLTHPSAPSQRQPSGSLVCTPGRWHRAVGTLWPPTQGAGSLRAARTPPSSRTGPTPGHEQTAPSHEQMAPVVQHDGGGGEVSGSTPHSPREASRKYFSHQSKQYGTGTEAEIQIKETK